MPELYSGRWDGHHSHEYVFDIDVWHLRPIFAGRIGGARRHRLARLRPRRLPRWTNLEGLSGTGGIRYQFTPDAAVIRGVMPVKAPYKAPVMQAVNWTGFYVGGFGGATLGAADWGYAAAKSVPTSAATILAA